MTRLRSWRVGGAVAGLVLYFGRNVEGGGVVSEREFRRFLAHVVTPRFPDGLSVPDVAGQFHTGAGTIVREPSKLVVILVPDAATAGEVPAIVAVYKRRFRQESVLHAEHPACLSFEERVGGDPASRLTPVPRVPRRP